MSTIIIIAYLLIAVLFGLSLFVALSRTVLAIKINFILLNLAISAWIISNTYADLDTAIGSLLWTRIAFASGAASVAALLCFVLTFPRYTNRQIAATIAIYVSLIPIFILSFSPFLIPSVNIVSGSANVVTGNMYGLFIIYVMVIIGASIWTLFRKWRNETGADRQRLVYVFWGATITIVLALGNNIIIPLFTGSNPYAVYGTYSLIILISTLAYAIFRHKLFSIRLATARAVAYTMSGATLALIFTAVLLVAEQTLFSSTQTTTLQRIFYGASAVVIGFTFPIIRTFFNSITRKILLNDSYDVERVLASIADIAANATSSKTLFLKSNKEMLTSIHLENVTAYLKQGDQWQQIASTSHKTANILDFDLKPYHKNSDVIDLVKIGSPLADNFALLLILSTSSEVLGAVAVGHKKNGFNFTKQDIRMFEGIAHELSVATENMVRFEEIKKFNETLQVRIQEATKELRINNKKLRDLDTSKDEFISMASHQLRTPLTSIKGYISMLLDEDLGEIKPEQRKALEEAFDSSQRMVYLIGDFLNLSRMQTGKFELERTSVLLPTLLGEEIEQLRQAAKTRHVTLLYDEPANFPPLNIDETKIRQVMMNFIDNAIYYAKPSGGEILIVLETKRDEILFRVRDNGIGVPLQARKKLFSKFFRADNAKKARPDGTGIGLYMAKRVVVAHGGEIIFESKEDEGSEFGFRLPI